MIDRGPENEHQDWRCPLCGMILCDIAQPQAQAFHDRDTLRRKDECLGKLRLLSDENQQQTMNTKEQKTLIVKKSVKHTFTPEEIAALNVDFRQAYTNLGAVQAEFDSVKAVWKAKETEAESRMETLNATLQAGFEMRVKELVCVFRPADKKKDFYLRPEDTVPSDFPITPILTEDMTADDFAQDLIQAESAFESKAELILWNAGNDVGKMVVGTLGGRWFSAIRGNVGAVKIEERLDSEQKSAKKRFDAITTAAKRVNEWLKSNLGPDTAKGFSEAIFKVTDAEKEKAE